MPLWLSRLQRNPLDGNLSRSAVSSAVRCDDTRDQQIAAVPHIVAHPRRCGRPDLGCSPIRRTGSGNMEVPALHG